MKILTKNKDIDVRRLRCTLGWLGIALPWLVVLLLGYFPGSISATYYTYQAGPVFMIILGASSFLLMAYRGYEKIDDIINTISGIAGLGICVFPCYNKNIDYVGTFQLPSEVSNYIHTGSAIVFFCLLAYSSIFLFTKSAGAMTKRKRIRNVIYRVCGIGMVASFAILLVPIAIKTWLMEAVALFFFGISFLTKANVYRFLAAEDNITLAKAVENLQKSLTKMATAFKTINDLFNPDKKMEDKPAFLSKDFVLDKKDDGPSLYPDDMTNADMDKMTLKQAFNNLYGRRCMEQAAKRAKKIRKEMEKIDESECSETAKGAGGSERSEPEENK